jgi:hypothetical protein
MERGEHRDPNPQSPPSPGGLPIWVTIVVVLTLTGLLAWNIIVVGPDGLPTSYVLGGLLGAYAGVDQLLKRRPGETGAGGAPQPPHDDEASGPP